MRQTADLCSKKLDMPIEVAADGKSFATPPRQEKEDGVISVWGRLDGNDRIHVRLVLVKGHNLPRVSAGPFFRHLGSLGENIRLFSDESVPEQREKQKFMVPCSSCGKRFKVSIEFAGRSGPCPVCGAAIQIPSGPQTETDIKPDF